MMVFMIMRWILTEESKNNNKKRMESNLQYLIWYCAIIKFT